MDLPKKANVGFRFSRSENFVAKLAETPSKLSTYTFTFSELKSFLELTSPLSKGKCCKDFVLMSYPSLIRTNSELVNGS